MRADSPRSRTRTAAVGRLPGQRLHEGGARGCSSSRPATCPSSARRGCSSAPGSPSGRRPPGRRRPPPRGPRWPGGEARTPAGDRHQGQVDRSRRPTSESRLQVRVELGVARHPDGPGRPAHQVAVGGVGPVRHRSGAVHGRHQPHRRPRVRRARRAPTPRVASPRPSRPLRIDPLGVLGRGQHRHAAEQLAASAPRRGRGAGARAGRRRRPSHASRSGRRPRRRRTPACRRSSGSATIRTPSMSRTTVEWPSQVTSMVMCAFRSRPSGRRIVGALRASRSPVAGDAARRVGWSRLDAPPTTGWDAA